MSAGATLSGHNDASSPVLVQSGEKVESSTPAVAPIGKYLSDEIRQFHDDCSKRYAFNSR
jgi:hypothetical protein